VRGAIAWHYFAPKDGEAAVVLGEAVRLLADSYRGKN
jgi:hypothetical protein